MVGEGECTGPAPAHEVYRDGDGVELQHLRHHDGQAGEEAAGADDERRVEADLQHVSQKGDP